MDATIRLLAHPASTWGPFVGRVLGAAALLLLSLATVPVALEIAIRLDLVPVGPVLWYRPADKARDTQIDAVNAAFAATNPFEFNAPIPAPDLPPRKRKRIAVIGDSVIWGSGLKLGEQWSFKLSELIAATHPEIEVVSWGHNGWSTKQELDFLKSSADQFSLFHVDGILVGFFTNDPDIDSLSQQRFLKFDGPVSKAFARVLPNAFAFASAYGGAIYGKYIDRTLGYARWEDSLYEPANLARYDGVLREMKSLADAHGAWLAFLLTPTFPYPPYFAEKFAKISALLDKNGIPYLNPEARVVADFSKMPGAPLYRKLWANDGNAHPGARLTKAYAEEAYAFLDHKGLLDRVASSDSSPAATAAETKGCGVIESAVVASTPTPYRLMGTQYVRLRGTVPHTDVAGTLSAADATIVTDTRRFPILLLPSGKTRVPEAELNYPENSFWVDLPAEAITKALRLDLHDVNGCTVSVPVAITTAD